MSLRCGDTEIAILITIIIEPDRSGPAWKQRITLYSSHYEALEMKPLWSAWDEALKNVSYNNSNIWFFYDFFIGIMFSYFVRSSLDIHCVRVQLLDQRRHHMLYTIKRWLKDPWNRTDLCMYLFFIISIVLRFVLPMHDLDFRWARAFYSFTLVLFFLRTLQFFFVRESIGPKVIMIQKMVSGIKRLFECKDNKSCLTWVVQKENSKRQKT